MAEHWTVELDPDKGRLKHQWNACRQLSVVVSNGERQLGAILPREAAPYDDELRRFVKEWKAAVRLYGEPCKADLEDRIERLEKAVWPIRNG